MKIFTSILDVTDHDEVVEDYFGSLNIYDCSALMEAYPGKCDTRVDDFFTIEDLCPTSCMDAPERLYPENWVIYATLGIAFFIAILTLFPIFFPPHIKTLTPPKLGMTL